MNGVIGKMRLGWRLLNDPRVPTWVKVAVPLLVALYFLSPIDFIPDILLGVGQLDDIGVILLGLSLLARLSPPGVIQEHLRAMAAGAETKPMGRYSAGIRGTANDNRPYASGEPTRPIEGEYRVIAPED